MKRADRKKVKMTPVATWRTLQVSPVINLYKGDSPRACLGRLIGRGYTKQQAAEILAANGTEEK